ncbi:MAG: hypothetical protein HC905_26425 [Bacteroidales bacterium]|nr:hypothetical protein [Bacteroidales bacterium]
MTNGHFCIASAVLGGCSLISFGVVSYLVFTCPEYEEMEDGTLIRKD